MACLISMAFSMPLFASQTFTNEVTLQKSCLVGVPYRRVSGPAAKPSASCKTNGAVSSLNRSCFLSTTAKPVFEILCIHMNVDSCSQMIMHGYWVGPDIDDGCGYVEAYVNQIT